MDFKKLGKLKKGPSKGIFNMYLNVRIKRSMTLIHWKLGVVSKEVLFLIATIIIIP